MKSFLVLVVACSMLSLSSALNAYQEHDGPLSASLASRSVQNYEFVARSLANLNSNSNVRIALVQTGWTYIAGTESISF